MTAVEGRTEADEGRVDGHFVDVKEGVADEIRDDDDDKDGHEIEVEFNVYCLLETFVLTQAGQIQPLREVEEGEHT